MLSNDYLFSNIGIDSIGFHAPRHYVKLEELALIRQVDPEKYNKGLLSKEMRVADIDEDIISLGLKAGYNALLRGGISPKSIDALFVGTETEVYAAKSVSNIAATRDHADRCRLSGFHSRPDCARRRIARASTTLVRVRRSDAHVGGDDLGLAAGDSVDHHHLPHRDLLPMLG